MDAPIYKLPPVLIHDRLTVAEATERAQWHVSDFGVLPVFARGHKGKGIKVGIIDTGIDKVHFERGEFLGQIGEMRDFTGSPSGPWDMFGHGSHVLGIPGARAGNEVGGVGLAPEATYFTAKGLGDDGFGLGHWIASAIRWQVSIGCHIINLSLGSANRDQGIIDAINEAVDSGVIVVAAAGNEGDNSQSWPAMHPLVISVAAIDRNRRAAPFSSPSSVDVAAPGVEILSTYRNGQFAVLSGTSMAAPWVTGLLALRLSAELATHGKTITKTADALKMLIGAAVDIGDAGPDKKTGPGLVTPDKFLADLLTVAPPPAPPDGQICGRLVYGPNRWGYYIGQTTTPAA